MSQINILQNSDIVPENWTQVELAQAVEQVRNAISVAGRDGLHLAYLSRIKHYLEYLQMAKTYPKS